MVNAKKKGARVELKTRDYLEEKGYQCTKSGGSLGAFDLIAFSDAEIRLIQVKSNRVASPKERREIIKFRCPAGVCHKEIWVWKD
jgi:Holliday junction resolvase-like predicted endonuclease